MANKHLILKNITTSEDPRDLMSKGKANVDHALYNINNAGIDEYEFTDCKFDDDWWYNYFEIGLSDSADKLPSKITFRNCDFSGTIGNNAILIFGTKNNATITIENCHFAKVSNPLRLSNKSNAVGVKVLVKDCVVDEWEANADYAGFVLLQDYTSASAEEVEANNVFAPEKISITFDNLVYAGNKVMPENVADVVGNPGASQVVYGYADKANPRLIAYDEARYPKIKFK